MKKILLLVMCLPVILAAQNGVTVSTLNVNSGTVTFNVSWNKNAPELKNIVWLDSVWVFVDYNAAGVMTRLPLSTGATLTYTSAPGVGRVIQYPDNNKGVWVVGNAKSGTSGSFSATVKLLTATAVVAGACAYASNYPPVGEYTATDNIKFTGTPMYDLVLKHSGGSTVTQQVNSPFIVPSNYTLASFTDKTGAPGVIKCIPPATFTLWASATGFCEDDAAGITFALDGTEDGKKYQLFRNNGGAGDGSVLTGNGSALTFTGTFNVAGTYTARTVAKGLTCAIAMNGTHVITKNPLPASPDVTGDSRNCPGTVTLSASSSGAVIDWYDDDVTTSTLHTGESYTPEIATSTTYYAQARVENTGCLSARMAVTAEVDMDGCFTVPGATVDFSAFVPDPNAIKGSTWTLRDTRAGGNSYTYIVKKMADDRIWMVQDLMFGSCATSTATWRDDAASGAPLRQPTVYADASTTYVGHCRQATVSASAKTVNLYNWAGAMNHANGYYSSNDNTFECTGTSAGTVGAKYPANCRGICPEGWHIPTGGAAGEFQDLFEKLGGGAGLTISRVTAVLINFGFYSTTITYGTNAQHWHGVRGGYVYANNSLAAQSVHAHYWSSSIGSKTHSYCLDYMAGDLYSQNAADYAEKNAGRSVRCVRNY
jgi:uncharacterized protein (TIGR02145 family)